MQHEQGTRDAVEQLMDDHRRVEGLLDELEGADPEEMDDLLDELEAELSVHMEAEERFVYPAMEEIGDLEGFSAEGVSEHNQVRELIARFRELGSDDPGADGMVATIRAAIEHHVEEEETEAFPALREKMDPDRLAELSRNVENLRSQMMVRGEGESSVAASGGREDATKEELYAEAQARDIEGRSKMSADELRRALDE